MSTLFSNSPLDTGYRLRYMEVFNWGTFNGKVYRLQPDGRTSLLTGANGSGKTTLIDALLTVLVPNNKRFYNQSSGAESKKERDESSYFWGYYGKTFSELEEKSKTEQLRNKADNPYSVLLACFQNSGTQHTITLAQVRWYANGGLQKVFIVCPYPLNIEEHFGQGRFDLKGEWKKRLVKQFAKTETYNSFKEYAARFSELFGLKDKALSLFSQTVGIKVLGDLTQFIRQEMLEEPEADEHFRNLYTHYDDLLASHQAIEKDEKQLELLEPVIKNKDELVVARQRKEQLDFVEQQMPSYLGKIEYGLLQKESEQLELDTATAEKQKEILTIRIGRHNSDKEQLIAQKAALNIDAQVSLWSKDIEVHAEKRDSKKRLNQHYITACEYLHIDGHVNSEPLFRKNLDKVRELNDSVPKELDLLQEQRTRLKIKAEHSITRIESLQLQITSLQGRKNRIPDELVHARKRLAGILDVEEEAIPFIGELIKVKASEQVWEDAIEKLLHSFSMQLLVPADLSRAANEFIYTNDMQAKLVYHKVDSRPSNSIVRWPTSDDALINKLELKDSGYTNWLEASLLDRFNYHCTNDLEVFYGSPKAITSNGLMRNAARHEKDDRPRRWDKSKYRLGWDNRASIHYYQQLKYDEEKLRDQAYKEMNALGPQVASLQQKAHHVQQLMAVKHYDDIDWGQHAERIHSLNQQIDALKKSSGAYDLIVQQIQELERILVSDGEERDKLIKQINTLENKYNANNQRKLELVFDELSIEANQAIMVFLEQASMRFDDISSIAVFNTRTKDSFIKLKGSQKTADGLVNKLEKETIVLVAAFVHPSDRIIHEFPTWSGDVLNIKADLSGLEDLEDLYRTIKTQRLVEHKKRFRDYMDKSMLDALTSYRAWLNNEVSKIEDMIEELNIPLKRITFTKNPDTYLQLECRPLKGENEINIFRGRLNASIPNALDFEREKGDHYREQVFLKIKELITELKQEEGWRRKVTDVRNWLVFGAREYSVVENKPGQYHDNTASYSGGQKAQFTYAILGAAIAHQFGIFQQGKQHRSLRFITVDEAFSKLDPEKSKFLMEFCDQLNLQILVVTPLDKINIAEPYINAVHFVEIKNKMHSVLHNLTMEQYHEKKASFNQLAESQP